MKIRNKTIATCLTVAGLIAVATFVSVEQKTFAQAPPDPAHTAHVAAAPSQQGYQPGGQPDGQTAEAQVAELRARVEQLEAVIQQQSAQAAPGAMPTDAGNPRRGRTMRRMRSGATPAQGMAGMNMKGGVQGGPALADQFAELRTKMQRLETTIQEPAGASSDAYRGNPSMGNPRSASAMPMGGKSGMGPGKKPMQGKMAGMSGNSQSGAIPPMNGGAMPASGGMAMMNEKMDNMMGMMGKMMGGMGGGAPDAYRANPSMDNSRSAGAMPMGGKSGMGPGKKPMRGGMAGMGGHSQPGTKPPMSGGAMPASGGMAMMNEKMENMMGMMSKMMGDMGGGAPMSGGEMAMDSMDKDEMAMMNEKMDHMMEMMSKMMGGDAPAGTAAHQHNP